MLEIVNIHFNRLEEWEWKWGMDFLPNKCSTLRISRSSKPITANYTLKGHALVTEDSPKYLGVVLQPNLFWTGTLIRFRLQRNGTSCLVSYGGTSKLTTRLQDSCIPLTCETKFGVLLYCMEPAHHTQKLEMVQRRAARYVTNRYRNTSSVTSMLQ